MPPDSVAIIANNSARLGKNLWTEDVEGEPIKVYSAYNERDEADFVIGRLRDWIDQGNVRADCAVLYRSNAQSRVREEGLSLDEVAERTGCGRTCSACLPDLRSHLGKGRGAAGNPIGSG